MTLTLCYVARQLATLRTRNGILNSFLPNGLQNRSLSRLIDSFKWRAETDYLFQNMCVSSMADVLITLMIKLASPVGGHRDSEVGKTSREVILHLCCSRSGILRSKSLNLSLSQLQLCIMKNLVLAWFLSDRAADTFSNRLVWQKEVDAIAWEPRLPSMAKMASKSLCSVHWTIIVLSTLSLRFVKASLVTRLLQPLSLNNVSGIAVVKLDHQWSPDW